MEDNGPGAPARLRALVSWQSAKVSTLGARLTARQMPLSARADFAVLGALEEYGPLSQADLGRRLALDRGDVSGIVHRLEQHHHVDRQVDPDDRRRNTVRVTADGQKHLDDLQSRADTVQDELLAGLDAAERRQLQSLLGKLLDSHQRQPA